RYNVDLANNLGNLVHRVTSMAERYREGRLSAPARGLSNRLATVMTEAIPAYTTAMDRRALDAGIRAAFRIVDAAHEYIAEREPWVLAKAGAADALDEVLWTTAEAVRVAAVLLSPVMPGSAGTLLARVGAPARA